MSGGVEVNPEAMRALATMFAEAQHQTEQVKAAIEKPTAEQKDFGRSWGEPYGKDFTDSMAAIAADLANLAKLFGDVQAQLGQTSDMVVAGETTHVGTFNQISEESGSADTSNSEGR